MLDDKNTDHYDNGANISKRANSLYWISESKYREFSKKMFYCGCVQISTFIIPLMQAAFDICMGNFDTSSWILPLNVVVPFNTQTISGWLLSWWFQVNVNFTYAVGMILMTTDFSGSCYYIISICNHFELLMNSMDSGSKQKMWSNVKATLQRAIEQHIKLFE